MRGNRIHDSGFQLKLKRLWIGADFGMKASGMLRVHEKSKSRSQVTIAPSPIAVNSALACREASPFDACRLRSVVAAAIPVGYGSCSMLIIWRLAGTARNTPSHDTTMIQGIR